MPQLAAQDLATMRESVFFEGAETNRKLTRFWILLILASIIAGAGVVADSTATVIGAMIVAPLMTPIQGTMLAIVIADRGQILRSAGLVFAGAAAAIAVGFVLGLTVVNDVVATTNSQVSGRVSPRLIDLVAALATGVVGSVALARRDISDTLPGVAISISLVPPLSVVGLTLESGHGDEALGALLLFLTNVTAILLTGIVVMSIYGATRLGHGLEADREASRRKGFMWIGLMVLAVGVPLTASSVSIAKDTSEEAKVHDVGSEWAREHGWELVGVETEAGTIVARFEGPTPLPATDDLETMLRERGIDPADVTAELLPRATIELGES